MPGVRMWQGILNSKSKTFLAFCFSFLGGVAFMSLISSLTSHFSILPLYLSFFFLFAVILMFSKGSSFYFFIIVILFFFFGIARYDLSFPHAANDASTFNGQTVSLV